MKRLESSEAIDGYVAVLSHNMIGAPNVVFVEVTLDRHDDKVLEKFGSAFARFPEAIEAHLVTGEYDYLVKVAAPVPSTTNDSARAAYTELRASGTRVRHSRCAR